MVFLKKMFHRSKPYIVFSPLLAFYALFVALPLGFILYKGICGDAGNSVLQTLNWFFEYSFLKILSRSFVYAFLCTLVCFLIGFPAAYCIAFSSQFSQKILLFLVCVPFLSNFLLHVASWTFILEPHGFIAQLLQTLGIINGPLHFLYTGGSVLLGMVYCYLPFMVIPIYIALAKLDRFFCEASYDLGASWWQTICRIIFPTTKSGILTGTLLVFVPASGEFVIPELLGGDRFMHIGSLLSNLMLSSSLWQHASLCTIIFALTLGLASIIFYKCVDLLIDWGAR